MEEKTKELQFILDHLGASRFPPGSDVVYYNIGAFTRIGPFGWRQEAPATFVVYLEGHSLVELYDLDIYLARRSSSAMQAIWRTAVSMHPTA